MKQSPISIYTGHFGSGKTELSIREAVNWAKKQKTILVDLDIINTLLSFRRRAKVFGKSWRSGAGAAFCLQSGRHSGAYPGDGWRLCTQRRSPGGRCWRRSEGARL